MRGGGRYHPTVRQRVVDNGPLVVGLGIVAGLVALFFALSSGGGTGPGAGQPDLVVKNASAIGTIRERGQEEEEGGAVLDEYRDHAFPAQSIGIEKIQRAIAADKAVKRRGAGRSARWDFLGPDRLDVHRLGTQTYLRGTEWSGRVTALAVDPACRASACTLYATAAGGGVWRSDNALARRPNWKFISEGIPSNAIGSIAIDPNDPTGRTLYVGTGEANNSGDSEAGLGLYVSRDGGKSWALVPGSFAAANNRGIAWVAIDPSSPNHILIGTRTAAHGIGSNSSSVQPPGAPAVGIYESRDGGQSFALVNAGQTNEVRFDPSDSSVVYATVAGVGLIRSSAGGAAGTWETIFSLNRVRFSFSPVRLPNGKTRIYLSDSSAGAISSQAYRIDDARQPAAAMTASDNAAWVRLSSAVDGTPKFATWGYCNTPLVGSQCSYDQFILSPADRPDMVVLGGLMHYEELPLYAGPDRSNGRAVFLSTDAGETWTDQTGDILDESMHPDQHAVAFVPGDPDQMFVGSDGGVIRTSGTYTDATDQCTARGLTGVDLIDCDMWLKRIPTRLEPINAGLPTLQMYSIAVSPHNPTDDAIAGTQDNGSISFSGSKTWRLGVTGDGGDAGYDAVDPATRFHSYFFGLMDINWRGDDPETWIWISDPFNTGVGESVRFYPPTIADPVRKWTMFLGAQRVWRIVFDEADREFHEAHCNTTNEFGTSDRLFTGDCGRDWTPLGASVLTGAAFGTTKAGSNLVGVSRGTDDGTLWATTGGGRVLVSKNANAADPAAVTFTRVDTAAQPNRVPSSVYVDPENSNHAIVTFSGYNSTTPTLPGHVFDVVFNAAAGTATWTDISYDLLDQPVNDAVLDSATGDIYISTDFGVDRLEAGTQTWVPAATDLPTATVSGLTLVTVTKNGDGVQKGDRLLYAATHGRGAYRLQLK
jgi:hypothetical protein